jgi:hypothetical protein
MQGHKFEGKQSSMYFKVSKGSIDLCIFFIAVTPHLTPAGVMNKNLETK